MNVRTFWNEQGDRLAYEVKQYQVFRSKDELASTWGQLATIPHAGKW